MSRNWSLPAGTAATGLRSITSTTTVEGQLRDTIARSTGARRCTRARTAPRSTDANGWCIGTAAACSTSSEPSTSVPTTRTSRTPSTDVPYTTQTPAPTTSAIPAATAHGSAARSRRCRARAMNRRTDDGTASVSARTSRQLRPPPLLTGRRPLACRLWLLRVRPGERVQQFIAHQRDRRRAHGHHHVTGAAAPDHLGRHVGPGRYEHLVRARQVDRGGQRHPALARPAHLARPEHLHDDHLVGDRQTLGQL